MSWMRIAGPVVSAVAAVWFLALVLGTRQAAAYARGWNLLQLLSTDLLAFALLAAAVRLLVLRRRRVLSEEPADGVPAGALRPGKYAYGADAVGRRAGRQVRPAAPVGYKSVRRNG